MQLIAHQHNQSHKNTHQHTQNHCHATNTTYTHHPHPRIAHTTPHTPHTPLRSDTLAAVAPQTPPPPFSRLSNSTGDHAEAHASDESPECPSVRTHTCRHALVSRSIYNLISAVCDLLPDSTPRCATLDPQLSTLSSRFSAVSLPPSALRPEPAAICFCSLLFALCCHVHTRDTSGSHDRPTDHGDRVR